MPPLTENTWIQVTVSSAPQIIAKKMTDGSMTDFLLLFKDMFVFLELFATVLRCFTSLLYPKALSSTMKAYISYIIHTKLCLHGI